MRKADGTVPADATVTITLTGAGKKSYPLQLGPQGDFYALLPMPSVPVHLQYRLEVNAPSLSVAIDPIVGMLWAANHY